MQLDNLVTHNFLIAKNILTIGNRSVELYKDDQQHLLITPQYYHIRLSEWRDFRITGELPPYWKQCDKLEYSFFAFCSRSRQPFMFVTADEFVAALGDSDLPYTVHEKRGIHQIYRSSNAVYFTFIPNDASIETIYHQPYIRRCDGEMVIGRHLYPLFFEDLDESVEWIILTVNTIEGMIQISATNKQNVPIHKYKCPLQSWTSFPISHLDLLKDASRYFKCNVLIGE